MPKKKLPEPLVCNCHEHAEPWDYGNMTVYHPSKKLRAPHYPAALCQLPRLPRKGERVECRIVPAKNHR